MTTRNPFAAFDAAPSSFRLFEDTVNRLFSDSLATRPWTPSVDIVEDENELVLKADVPGVPMENIDIRFEDGTLTISGERSFEKKDEKGGYHRLERGYGSFTRCFALPDSVDPDKVTAECAAGVLTVKLPKKEVAKPRSIKVTLKQ